MVILKSGAVSTDDCVTLSIAAQYF